MMRDTANKIIEKFYGCLPEETAVHLVNVQKELLKAMGTIIDEQIKWTDIHLERSRAAKQN